jgi:hypothetical protein
MAPKANFDFLCSPRGVGQSLGDVVGFQVKILSENLVSRPSRGNEADDRSDGDAHAADARLSAHYGGVTGDAGQLGHVASVEPVATAPLSPNRAY